MAHEDYGGPEHGILQRLPPILDIHDHKPTKDRFGFEMQQSRRPHWIKSPPATDHSWSRQHPRCGSQRPQRTGNQLNWAAGGPGMQAVFLGSNQRSCGTGVFLPRRAGTDGQFRNKPGNLSPVLLPSRVIQTLNLNVHELGQIKSHPDQTRNIAEKFDAKLEKNKKADDFCYPPEILLPKEWTY